MDILGFVGYTKNGVTRGWINESDSNHSMLGRKVLEKYKNHSREELENFFVKKIELSNCERFYGTHFNVFDIDWDDDILIRLMECESTFLDSEDCKNSYVFDLDKDVVLVDGKFEIDRKGIPHNEVAFYMEGIMDSGFPISFIRNLRPETVSLVNTLVELKKQNKKNERLVEMAVRALSADCKI